MGAAVSRTRRFYPNGRFARGAFGCNGPKKGRGDARTRPARALGVILAVLALAPTPASAESELLGPLRIRDMTPFNLLRLDMLPAHAVAAAPGTWAIEAHLSYTNTFVMSDNVARYLEGRGARGPLTRDDVDAILSLGEDAYFVDGEFGLLDLSFHYAVTHRASVYFTIPVYDFAGGLFDGAIESFHDNFGFDAAGRDLVARNRFQAILSLDGSPSFYLEPPVSWGVGDPVLGMRHAWALGGSRWGLVLDGAAKLALRGARPLLSTGTNDFGVQGSLQGRFSRQAVYFSASLVRTDGEVLGVHLENRVVPTLTAAYEVGVTERTNLILQFYASESKVRDTPIEEIKANKYQASLGVRSRHGRLIYGFAVTENLWHYQNTPDLGVSVILGWVQPRGGVGERTAR